MTWIALYSTKKKFRAAVQANPHAVLVENPSFFEPFQGPLDVALETRTELFFTNHPKRSWFAKVWRRRDGSLGVE